MYFSRALALSPRDGLVAVAVDRSPRPRCPQPSHATRVRFSLPDSHCHHSFAPARDKDMNILILFSSRKRRFPTTYEQPLSKCDPRLKVLHFPPKFDIGNFQLLQNFTTHLHAFVLPVHPTDSVV